MARLPLLLLVFPLAARADEYWAQFRGGSKGGVAEAKTLPAVWDTKKNVVWSADVPGQGWSSPVVWGDKIFLTTVVPEESPKAPTKGLYIQDLNGKVRPGEHRWLVVCLDFKTGKTLWSKEVHKGKAPGPVHVKNTYASETPVADGKHVYALFGNQGLYCLDHDGKVVWSKPLQPRKTQLGWGPAASPALHRDKLFVVNDNEEKSALVCYDAATGKELWTTPRKETATWTTPFVWENDKRTEVVVSGVAQDPKNFFGSAGYVRSYALDGRQLWEMTGTSIITIPSPSAAHGLLYVSSGYVMDQKLKPVYAIRPGAEGDISLKQGETSNKHVAWSQPKAGAYHPSTLVYGDCIYVLLDMGFLSCYEAKTGKPVYEKKRLGGRAYTASPWAYDGKVFCMSEDGDTTVVKAGEDFEVLEKNSLDDMTLATPALANGSLLVRTMSKLYRIEKK